MVESQSTAGQDELDALVDLAQRQHRAGHLVEAAAAYQKILARRPDIAEAFDGLGGVLLAQGHIDLAAAQFARALALKPGLFHSHNNLGNVLTQQGRLAEAVAHYRQAIALWPGFAEALNNLANALRLQGKLDEALVAAERALALRPSFFQVHHNLGCILWEQHDVERAIASYRRALAINPRSAESYNNLGNALVEQGKLEEAAACFNQALALRPDFADAHYNRADLKKFHPGDPDLATLEQLAAARLPPDKLAYIHFALGKALEDVEHYERAFDQWRRGNVLKRRQTHYDEQAAEQMLLRVAEVFAAPLLQRFAGAGDPSQLPIFVVGMPRSGSTLIAQILASHPQVQAAGELMNLDRLAQKQADVAGAAYPDSIAALDAAGFHQLGADYLASLPALATDKTRLVDKALGNFLHVGLIRLILPQAHIIHAVRNPADTCLSCFSKLFAVSQPFAYDLTELGRYYCWYRRLMDHWQSVLPAGAMLEVAYEAVIDDLEGQARRLVEFCGLPWDDRCLTFHETERPVRTASAAQVRQPLYRSSIARWRRYEVQLDPLLVELNGCQSRQLG